MKKYWMAKAFTQATYNKVQALENEVKEFKGNNVEFEMVRNYDGYSPKYQVRVMQDGEYRGVIEHYTSQIKLVEKIQEYVETIKNNKGENK